MAPSPTSVEADSLIRALEEEEQYGVAPEAPNIPTEIVPRQRHHDDDTCVSSVTDGLIDADLFMGRMYPTLNLVPEEEESQQDEESPPVQKLADAKDQAPIIKEQQLLLLDKAILPVPKVAEDVIQEQALQIHEQARQLKEQQKLLNNILNDKVAGAQPNTAVVAPEAVTWNNGNVKEQALQDKEQQVLFNDMATLANGSASAVAPGAVAVNGNGVPNYETEKIMKDDERKAPKEEEADELTGSSTSMSRSSPSSDGDPAEGSPAPDSPHQAFLDEAAEEVQSIPPLTLNGANLDSRPGAYMAAAGGNLRRTDALDYDLLGGTTVSHPGNPVFPWKV
ncbi:expressed unknown protein [Seminavis robusta]|uniref:Uncharacterized protein n=1 Tax=Seminavis robusta TaxID=568900 RepID=A0A9N8DYL7_9STRA|nr:expressed unknown protein [Seminavis robusta]|eukprot:Sro393_g133530.1 n/a (337) ;mRNA; f:12827-14003